MTSTRAQFLTGVAAVSATAAASSHSAEASVPSVFKSAPVQTLAPGVFALEGVVGHAWCNLAWVEFSDYVAVLDAGSHSLAEAVLPMIRSTTDKPIRFVLNTHHHRDHCYGNEAWMQRGAAVMAYTGMPAELARVEPGRLRAYPTLTEHLKPYAAEIAATHVERPSVLLPSHAALDDGTQRVEFLYLGKAHTAADMFAWLPEHRILITGDVAVNGPYNVMWDAHPLSWIDTLRHADALKAEHVVPGHGPVGTGAIVSDQFAYLTALRDSVKAIIADGGDASAIKAEVEPIRKRLLTNARIKRYVITDDVSEPDVISLGAQMGHFYTDLTGKPYLALERVEEIRRLGLADLCCGAFALTTA